MLATYILGQLSPENTQALTLLKTEVGKDKNWRVQEMLAKAFDYYCKTKAAMKRAYQSSKNGFQMTTQT